MRTARSTAGALLAPLVAVALLAVPATALAEDTPTVETTPSAPATVTPPAPVPPPVVDTRPVAPSFVPKTGKAIYLDRRRQRIYLYENGRQIDTFLCSTSRTLPRRGTYYVKFQRYASSSFNGKYRFYWQTVFTKGPHGHNIAFHSIPVDRRGRIIAPVGKPVSAGCVRCPYSKAKFLYRWITKRTPIIVRP